MSTPAVSLPPALASLRAQAVERWGAFAPRERLAIGAALALIGVYLVWAIAMQPAWRTLRDAPAQLDRLDAQLQQMQRLAAESKTLRGTAPVSPGQAAVALTSATERLGAQGYVERTDHPEKGLLLFTRSNGTVSIALQALDDGAGSAVFVNHVEGSP